MEPERATKAIAMAPRSTCGSVARTVRYFLEVSGTNF